MNADNLEREFHKSMEQLCRTAIAQCNYRPTIFMQMLQNYGGVNAAKRLLASNDIQYGFERLWSCKRLDLTVEAHVLLPGYKVLFSEDELMEARRRLQAHDYNFPH